MVNPRVWGDGDPEGVRQRAAEEMKTTARAAAAFGVDTVIGFTGSSIWHYLAMFPPVGDDVIQAGYADFADRWNPIIDVFDEVGVRFAHEVHPSEIAYDYWSTVATLEAIGHRPGFGLNFDPSHMVWQELDYVGFLWDFADRIYHVDCKDTKVRMGNGRNGRLGSHLPWADPRRGWDFISTGHGDTRWEDIFRMLNHIGYDGPISVEWEDAGMDRLAGAPEALEFIRRMNAITPPAASFDAAFATKRLTTGHGVGPGSEVEEIAQEVAAATLTVPLVAVARVVPVVRAVRAARAPVAGVSGRRIDGPGLRRIAGHRLLWVGGRLLRIGRVAAAGPAGPASPGRSRDRPGR